MLGVAYRALASSPSGHNSLGAAAGLWAKSGHTAHVQKDLWELQRERPGARSLLEGLPSRGCPQEFQKREPGQVQGMVLSTSQPGTLLCGEQTDGKEKRTQYPGTRVCGFLTKDKPHVLPRLAVSRKSPEGTTFDMTMAIFFLILEARRKTRQRIV